MNESTRCNLDCVKIFRASSETVRRVKSGRKQPRIMLLEAWWVVLALYIFDYSPMGIGAAAFTGSFDPNHKIRFQTDGGGLQLVLHHSHGCIGHHHGIIARTLTLFAQPATNANPDHIIQFGSVGQFSSPTQVLPSKLTQARLPMPAPAEISIAIPNPALTDRDQFLHGRADR